MRGFAYPNVEFSGADRYHYIGCGRYRTSARGQEAGEEPADPNVGHLAELLAAAVALVPELMTSAARIYESRDQLECYQGDSLALAYFLALIHRGRCMRLSSHNIEGDIWCTGTIRLGINRSPLLTEVEQSGFDVKLRAFLSPTNPDRVFLVSAAHLTAENMYLCRTPPEATWESVQPLSLSAWCALLRQPLPEVFRDKVVVGIQADELPLLVQILFESPADPEEVPEHVVAPAATLSRSLPPEELRGTLAAHRDQKPPRRRFILRKAGISITVPALLLLILLQGYFSIFVKPTYEFLKHVVEVAFKAGKGEEIIKDTCGKIGPIIEFPLMDEKVLSLTSVKVKVIAELDGYLWITSFNENTKYYTDIREIIINKNQWEGEIDLTGGMVGDTYTLQIILVNDRDEHHELDRVRSEMHSSAVRKLSGKDLKKCFERKVKLKV